MNNPGYGLTMHRLMVAATSKRRTDATRRTSQQSPQLLKPLLIEVDDIWHADIAAHVAIQIRDAIFIPRSRPPDCCGNQCPDDVPDAMPTAQSVQFGLQHTSNQ